MKFSTLWRCGALGLLISCLLIPGGYRSQAQTTKTEAAGPPKVFWILKEEIKPGKVDAYRQLQERYIQIYTNARFAYNWVGTIPAAGSSSNAATFYLELDSLDAMEQVNKEFQRIHVGQDEQELLLMDQAAKDVVGAQSETISTYRPDLSAPAGTITTSLRDSAYLQVVTVQVQAGKELEWAAAVAESAAALNKAGTSQPFLTYQVISGEAPGTFLLMYPSASSGDLNTLRERERAALGAEGARKLAKVAGDTVLKEEFTQYAVDRRISYSKIN